MKATYYLILLGITHWLCSSSASDFAEGQAVLDIPATEILIAEMPALSEAVVSSNLLQLVHWPIDELAGGQHSAVDRTREFPPLYREDVGKQRRPSVSGALPPSRAKLSASNWVRRVLAPNYIPEDLDSRLILLQRSHANESAIVCRYRIDGTAIQITQRRTHMWVVISPAGGVRVDCDNKEEMSRLLEQFFTEGAKAKEQEWATKEFDQGIKVCTRTKGAWIPWWNWTLCYSDGNALAILFPKVSMESPRYFGEIEPWF